MSDQHGACSGLSPRDTRCIAAIRRGNVAAFEAFFRTHESLVYNVCVCIVGSPDVAGDLVQDIFCDLWDRRQHWSPRTSLQAYLAGAARNKALSWLKRSQTRESLDDWEEVRAVKHLRSRATPHDALLYLDLGQALQQAIEQLPERRRLVYKMVREQHMSYAQIAAALDISENTVRTQMGRALKSLRSCLRSYS